MMNGKIMKTDDIIKRIKCSINRLGKNDVPQIYHFEKDVLISYEYRISDNNYCMFLFEDEITLSTHEDKIISVDYNEPDVEFIIDLFDEFLKSNKKSTLMDLGGIFTRLMSRHI